MHLVFASISCGMEEHVISEASRLNPMLLGEKNPRPHEEGNNHHTERTALGYGRPLGARLPKVGANLERDLQLTKVRDIGA